jgi:hypothetical protein
MKLILKCRRVHAHERDLSVCFALAIIPSWEFAGIRHLVSSLPIKNAFSRIRYSLSTL